MPADKLMAVDGSRFVGRSFPCCALSPDAGELAEAASTPFCELLAVDGNWLMNGSFPSREDIPPAGSVFIDG